MSVHPGQPSTMGPSEPGPIVSDIPVSQPLPAVSPAPANGTGSPSDTSGAHVSSSGGSAGAPANPGPAPSVSAQAVLPSNGPSSSAPSQQQSHPPHPANPASHLPKTFGHVPPQLQFYGNPGRQQSPANYQAQAHHTIPPVYPPPQLPAQVDYQRQPVQPVQQQQQGYQTQSSRPTIMEAPRKRSSMGMAVAMPPTHSVSAGFPSPTKNYPSAFPKFSDDLSRNTLAIKQSVPEAVRQAVRDNWEKCLLGSEFHQAFVNRAVHDFGANLVANCKTQLIEHFSNRDLDDVADLILAKASNAFLDKALEMRLATIDAKPLLNALARAERLGYDSQDVVEESRGELVIPHAQMGQVPAAAAGAGPAARANGGSRAAHPNELQCWKCFRTFTKKSYFDYHISRGVCGKLPPTADGFRYACAKCGQGFTQSGGLGYHTSHLVCDGGVNASSDPPQANNPATPGPVYSNASPAQPNMTQTPSSQPPATSATAGVGVLPANRLAEVSATKASSPGADPYGHLNEEQMDALNAELLQAEEQYAGRFHEAEAIADPEQKRIRVESLRNTFGTKQSMIRKKYGVRLRERRTRAEIQAERERMGLNSFKAETASQSPAPMQQQPGSASSGWTAANKAIPTYSGDDSTPSAKRRRGDDGGYDAPYPQQQTGPTTKVSEMAGGLTASSATAALHEPTLPPSSTPARTYQHSGARVEIPLPSKPSPSKPLSAAASTSGPLNGHASRDESMTPDIMDVDDSTAHRDDGNIKADAEAEESENENDIINTEDDSDDDDDGDIPASLPPTVRHSSQLGSMY